jgi:putative selenate reductase
VSDELFTYPIEKLWQWILAEEKSGSIFGITKELFFRPSESDPFQLQRYGKRLETPIGVAAGPHTQLSQNIVTSWLCGARYIELKTVQILDDIKVSKPCIDMEDEGYNCEWSQELSLDESYDQYLDAWILIHLLRHHFGLGNEEPGFMFNMSLGYNLEGIHSLKMQRFLDKMVDCRVEKSKKIKSLITLYPAIKDIKIPNCISENVTLSTMHGCPAEEIEQIGRYLVAERGLHTTIKLNPTLLGPKQLRHILNEQQQFDVIVPDEAFEHDIQFTHAIAMIRRLQKAANENKVSFSIKLTNTLETINKCTSLPESENTIYMSGRALHPISIAVAAKLQSEFDGSLDISFSAGADCFNTPEIVAAGLAPVTICSDLLKPSGYGRLAQYLSELKSAMNVHQAGSIEDFVLQKSRVKTKDVNFAALKNLADYSLKAVKDEKYQKNDALNLSIKTQRSLPPFDCIKAPCVETCPTNQDVPEYMRLVQQNECAAAFEVIMRDNPFPALTGMACDHACQFKCTRQAIDSTLYIRDVKRFISEHGQRFKPQSSEGNNCKVAIIGGGPSGLACAWFLALAGFEVNVYDSNSNPGGMPANAIPRFRLPDEALLSDIARIRNAGVKIHNSTTVNAERFQALRTNHDYIYIAVGAPEDKKLNIPGEESPGVYNALELLAEVRTKSSLNLGRNVAVIGGGDSAVDAARTARRLVGENGQVTLIYRRTKKEMPANHEELMDLIREKVHILELASPLKVERRSNKLKLTLQKMSLGQVDESGRRKPIPIPGSEFIIVIDSLISAIGQNVVLDFLDDPQQVVGASPQRTEWPNVFIGGDAMRGPATIIAAIADGKGAAKMIAAEANIHVDQSQQKPHIPLCSSVQQVKMATRNYGPIEKETTSTHLDFSVHSNTMSKEAAHAEAEHCLSCDQICNLCVSVCPNRAILAYETNSIQLRLPKIIIKNGVALLEQGELFVVEQKHQVLNLVDFCNECGNCATFCPTNGAPYLDKPRVCLSHDAFELETAAYKFERTQNSCTLLVKTGGFMETLTIQNGNYIYDTELVKAELRRSNFQVVKFALKNDFVQNIYFDNMAEMSVLLEALSKSPISETMGRTSDV